MADTSIRLIDITDAEPLSDLLTRSREAHARWLPERPDQFYTVHGQQRAISSLLEAHESSGSWPGIVQSDNTVIGQITISSIVRGAFQKGYLGYWVGVEQQRAGHAGRAVGQALHIASSLLQLHRLEAHTQLENIASQRVLASHGFRTWGVAHEHFYVDGAWRDELFWELRLTPNGS